MYAINFELKNRKNKRRVVVASIHKYQVDTETKLTVEHVVEASSTRKMTNHDRVGKKCFSMFIKFTAE